MAVAVDNQRGRYLTIRGERWRIVIGRPPQNKCDALCCFDRKTIYIRPKADRLACICHEILHACLPDLEEVAIMEIEEALVKGLSLVIPAQIGKK